MGAEADHGGLAGLGQTAPHLHLRPVGFVVFDDVVVVGFVVVDDVDDVVVIVGFVVVDCAAVVVADVVFRVEYWPSNNMSKYDHFFLL